MSDKMDNHIHDRDDYSRTGMEIAVIGMAGRFPGAESIDEFWENLKKGVESISFYSHQELKEAGIASGLLDNPNYIKAKGGMADIESFDSEFFEYTAKEAEMMDPQLRIFHEICLEALENAGYNPWAYEGLIGLYAGASENYHWLSQFLARVMTNRVSENEFFEVAILNACSSFCTRISYKLNLKGPSVFVQTACSTSLVAIYQGCQSLLAGECDMVLAGGVSISTPSKSGYLHQEGMIFSLKGHVRPFDSDADGTVFGSGVGIVVLKFLEDAIKDRDAIYAVVKGAAVNNDGLHKVGFTAPATRGQADVIQAAHRASKVKSGSIDYIEAHGTGTTLGDPIEVEALTLAFNTNKTGFCKIGSVKSSIGHLDAAAGVAGFIKTVLVLKNRMIPPVLNFQSPNLEIDFENTPFRVNTTLYEWKDNKKILRAGVSSFGLGGTNAHIVLEEWRQTPLLNEGSMKQGGGRPAKLILLSAKTGCALEQMTENIVKYLKKNPDVNLADVAYTLQVGRKDFNYRKMTVCSSVDEAVEILSSPEAERVYMSLLKKNTRGRPLVFMFSGQGSQYLNMGLDLYKEEPIFREELDRCFDILKTNMGYHIKNILFPDEAAPHFSMEDTRRRMDNVLNSGPIKFIFEYALAKMLMKWGIKPSAMIGHSLGEYTAAHLAGVFSLEDALKLVVMRGKLMQKTPEGVMISVTLSEQQLRPLLNDEISLAAVNNSSLCIVSGATGAMDRFEKEINEKGLDGLRLNFPRAAHSNLMLSISKEFETLMGGIKLNAPRIPYISGLSGDWITVEQATSPAYWAMHLIKTVRFFDGVKTLLKESTSIFVQVGADRGLPLFVSQIQGEKEKNTVLNIVRHYKESISDVYYLLNAVGFLWLNGVNIDWSEFNLQERRNRLALPTYPFEKITFRFKGYSLQPGKENLEHQLLSLTREDAVEETPGWMESERNTRTFYKTRKGSAKYKAPANKIQQILVDTWQNFFGFDRIGIDDDFFELGGDSLKSSLLIAKIHKKLNVKIPIPEFFKRPTIRSLALFTADKTGKNIYSSIEPVEEKEYYPLSSAQKRLYVIHQMSPQNVNYNISNVFILDGELDGKKLEQVFKKLINRHQSFRTTFELINGIPIQRIYDEVAFEIEYHESQKFQEIGMVENFIRPFDLTQAPLMRIGLIKEGCRHIVILDIHHIISDFISFTVLIKDFSAFYRGHQLPPLKIQYHDYSQWHNRLIESEKIKEQEKYWLKVFEGSTPVLNLPTDFPRPPVQSLNGENINFTIETALYEKLCILLTETRTTLYILLLAVCNVLLWKYTGQESIVIGSPVMGRSHVDLENIIGMFVGQLAMKNHPSAYKTFRELLEEIKKNAVDAYENQDYPFEVLTAKMGLQGISNRHPLYDVVLAVFNQNLEEEPGDLSSIGDLQFKPYPFEDKTSKIDLRFAATETAGEVQMTLTYCPALFKRHSCEKMVERFMEILTQVVENSDIKLAEISVSHGFSIAESHAHLDAQSDFGF